MYHCRHFVKQQYIEQLNLYQRHAYNLKHQSAALKYIKGHLKHNKIVMVADFSENYSCKYSEEVQSAHFEGAEVTLHTGVFYSKCNIKGKQFATNITYKASTVWAQLTPILKEIKSHHPKQGVPRLRAHREEPYQPTLNRQPPQLTPMSTGSR